jgi:hypothetical protein
MTATNAHEPKTSLRTRGFLTEILEHDTVLSSGDKKIVHRLKNNS